ncbi:MULTISPECIES: Ldh family oxidoreductase [unclassified Paraburkholderia]|uniref:Ldh family oxidoreductase n=1 Tax=unclassified Paraburkholderia TaxID=2615204 RepID=UPI00161FE407|nr:MULTISPECIES: Ldh family oxidoreductase [unclassified Paraburkholderia]MBB5445668.1 (2R)-3-sulfolactate dehydrogenase (NADP+) [Paraburkholderia sp. WSM4177]MBB5486280.1 (2R)-3-sulfolactate dehydrogenase (NADP+) [Paraburkholderia sp. WSM4180]
MARLFPDALTALAIGALRRADASPATAGSTACALVYADVRGLSSHGVSRLPMYCAQLRNGRVDPAAQAVIVADRGAAVLIDGADGLAYPACDLAVATLAERARQYGSAVAGIRRSHHFGVGAAHLAALGEAGMVALAFSNSPAAMPAWGGRRALFGTNPIAAVFPRRNGAPLVIDLALSQIARGKIALAARDGKPIPEGWATTRDGLPTTDARAALDGMMLPFGGAKGAMLALVVELLAAALSGANFGYEAGSFLTEEGERSRIGHLFWAIDPGALAGDDAYLSRVEALIEMMLMDDDVRLPGYRREQLAQAAYAEGVDIPDALIAQLECRA